MLCRNAKPDRPILAAEPGDHGMVGQHRLVPAGTGHLDVTPVSGEVVKGPNLSRAHRLQWNDARTSCKRVSDLKLKLTLNSNLRVNRRQLGRLRERPNNPSSGTPRFWRSHHTPISANIATGAPSRPATRLMVLMWLGAPPTGASNTHAGAPAGPLFYRRSYASFALRCTHGCAVRLTTMSSG